MNDQTKEGINNDANLYIDFLEDALQDLDRFSVENDDVFSSEVYEMRDLILRARKQLPL
jgi:hypothetical protein